MDPDAPRRRRRSTPRGPLGTVRRRVASTWARAGGASRTGAVVARWRRLSRRQARIVLAAAGALALATGYGAAALATGLGATEVTAAPEVRETTLGPVAIALPGELGPWTLAPAAGLEALRTAQALGGTAVDGAWARVAPGAMIVTVLTADAGEHGGLAGVTGPFGQDSRIPWDGGREHLAGAATGDGLRELVLVTQTDEGDLVLLSVSGPVEAFASGALEEAFRAARIVD